MDIKLSRTRSVHLLGLIGILYSSQISAQVCVFDLDGTLLQTSKQLDRNAIDACKSQGYKLAVNTAEDYSWCPRNRKYVESLGLVVPDDMYLCHDPHVR